MTAAKNLQVIRTIQKSTNFALQAKGGFQLAGCQILLSKQFHCDLQNRHKPYIPLLPSWLPKKGYLWVFFLLLKSTKLPFAKKKLLYKCDDQFLGATWRPSKTAQGGEKRIWQQTSCYRIRMATRRPHAGRSQRRVFVGGPMWRCFVSIFNQRLQCFFLHKLGFLWILSCFRWSISNLQKKAVYTGMSCSKWTISSMYLSRLFTSRELVE